MHLVSFLCMKKIYEQAILIEENLINSYNINAFESLKKLYENWNGIKDNFEMKSFINLSKKEIQIIKEQIIFFQSNAKQYQETSLFYNKDLENVNVNIDKLHLEENEYSKNMLIYVISIKERYLEEFSSEDNIAKKCLKHINQILDSLNLVYFFENFMNYYQSLEDQSYFEIVDSYSINSLLNVIDGKILDAKRKYF